MNDRELQQLFPDYLTGRLDPATCRAIEQRCKASPEMRSALEAAKQYIEAVGAVEPVRASDDFLASVHRRIEQPKGLRERLFNLFPGRLPVELAGVAITVVLLVLLYNPFSGRLPLQAVKQRSQSFQKYKALQEAPAATPPAVSTEKAPPSAYKTPKEANTAEMQPESKPAFPVQSAAKKQAIAAAVKKKAISPLSRKQAEEIEKKDQNVAASSGFAPEPPSPAPADAQPQHRLNSPASVKKESVAVYASSSAPKPPIVERLTSGDEPMSETPTGAAGFTPMADAVYPEEEPDYERTDKKEQPAVAVRALQTRKAVFRPKARRAEAPASEAAEYSAPQDTPDLYGQVEKTVKKFRGRIDSVMSSSPQKVKIRVTVDSDRLGHLNKYLVREFNLIVFSPVASRSDEKTVTVVFEVQPR